MRLKHIRVKKLFGIFDHDISVYLEDRITIIHGPNGYGKTAVLKLIQAILTNQFSTFRRIPFSTVTAIFEDETEISVTKLVTQKENGEKIINQTSLKYELKELGKGKLEHTIESSASRLRLGIPNSFVEQHVPGLQRVGPDVWVQIDTGRRLHLDDIVEIYGDFLPISNRDRTPRNLPHWIEQFPLKFDVRLIEAQRLLNVSDRKRQMSSEMTMPYEPAVASYSRELADKIQEKQAQYGTFSQQLDSTFPTRVLKKNPDGPATFEQLESKLRELEEHRQRIIKAGLLTKDPQAAPIFGPDHPIDASTKGILSLYAEDVEKKLGVFSDITAKIELFKELVNKRFTYKQLDVDRQNGFQLNSTVGLALVPTDLSSGEQHELVLLYELLFRTKANALILIDEPELSLHVAWQVEFLKDLERVIKLSSFDVILATHSPQIINNRWDLTKELEGPQL